MTIIKTPTFEGQYLKSWNDFNIEEPEIATVGKNLLFKSRAHVGYAFLATLRKDGAPRLHPVSVILSQGHLYVIIPVSSPKCADLIRDGRYALQAFPSTQDEESGEFYLAGHAQRTQDVRVCQALVDDARVAVEDNEVLFELFLERVMYTKPVDQESPIQHIIHKKWQVTGLQYPQTNPQY